jgi:hypothetical protein|tara:strand:+ start:1288 stop:3048 length:1761 start_codon:yes stop_codon:yes gene_type:complete
MSINTAPKYAGEPTTQSVASGLATLGRYGDNYMVHAAEGETMIPKEVFDENPTLKQDLFRQMAMMGIKDPNRYVVGHELNSINPDTGQPEFFFKKIFKAVKKVVKKIAPIAAPIIGNMIAPGIGGLIASGLVTKMQGGSWGDVAKSVALSYGASALTSGISGALQGTSFGNTIGLGPVNPAQGGIGSFSGGAGGAGTGFLGGLSRGVQAPFNAGANLFSSGAANPLSQGIFGPRGTGTFFGSLAGTEAAPSAFAKKGVGLFPGYQTGNQLTQAGINPTTGQSQLTPQAAAYGAGMSAQYPTPPPGDAAGSLMQNPPGSITASSSFVPGLEAPGAGTGFAPTINAPASNVGEGGAFGFEQPQYVNPVAAETAKTTAQIQAQTAADYADAVAGTGKYSPESIAAASSASDAGSKTGILSALGYEGPGSETISKALIGSAVPLALAGAAYFLTPEEETTAQQVAALDATNPRRVAYDKWQGIADKNSEAAMALKNEWYGQSSYTAEQLSRMYGAQPISGITAATERMGNAMGGEIIGPGTGTSDSIPARLSDGEFVMTAQAVRNAGNGNRDVGAARMYDMMNRFEQGTA